MPKVKVPRKNISIDMTPMVDMAFLLVTFFMLTTQFQPDEPVTPAKPHSTSQIIVPPKDKMTITISKENKVFFDLTGKQFRRELILKLTDKYGYKFNQDEINKFSVLATMGIPMNQMQQFLDLEPEDRKRVPQPGIPIDSANNQLSYWILYSRASNPNAIITIIGDKDANYSVIKQVIKTLQEQDINRFSLITDTEAEPVVNKKS